MSYLWGLVRIPPGQRTEHSNVIRQQLPSNHYQLATVWETEAVVRFIKATTKSGPRPPWTGAEGLRSNYASIDANTCYQYSATQCTENARPKRSPTSTTWAILDTLEICAPESTERTSSAAPHYRKSETPCKTILAGKNKKPIYTG
jgi:hypothetical protein